MGKGISSDAEWAKESVVTLSGKGIDSNFFRTCNEPVDL